MRSEYGDASEYYELTFAPPAGEPGERHPIQGKIDKPGRDARTRMGYFAGP